MQSTAVRAPRAPHPFADLSTPLAPTRTVLLTADPAAADPVAAKRAELRRYFHQTCEIYDRLFTLIRDDASYYVRHEPLRHPLIFYYAHPAVFYVNKLTAGRYIPERLDARLEAMMAVGVDEMSWDDLNTAHYDWPSVAAVRDYRAAVRDLVDEFIRTMPLELPIAWNSPAWVILMGIEHERIHLETSSVIMRQMPLDELRHGAELSVEEQRLWGACPTSGSAPANEWLAVPGRKIRLGLGHARLRVGELVLAGRAIVGADRGRIRDLIQPIQPAGSAESDRGSDRDQPQRSPDPRVRARQREGAHGRGRGGSCGRARPATRWPGRNRSSGRRPTAAAPRPTVRRRAAVRRAASAA